MSSASAPIVVGEAARGVTIQSLGKSKYGGWDADVGFNIEGVCKGKRAVRFDAITPFVTALVEMERTLAGTAQLQAYDGEIQLEIGPIDKMGHLVAVVEVRDFGHTDVFELKFRVPLDQSYLPRIVEGLHNHFPETSK